MRPVPVEMEHAGTWSQGEKKDHDLRQDNILCSWKWGIPLSSCCLLSHFLPGSRSELPAISYSPPNRTVLPLTSLHLDTCPWVPVSLRCHSH